MMGRRDRRLAQEQGLWIYLTIPTSRLESPYKCRICVLYIRAAEQLAWGSWVNGQINSGIIHSFLMATVQLYNEASRS